MFQSEDEDDYHDAFSDQDERYSQKQAKHPINGQKNLCEFYKMFFCVHFIHSPSHSAYVFIDVKLHIIFFVRFSMIDCFLFTREAIDMQQFEETSFKTQTNPFQEM